MCVGLHILLFFMFLAGAGILVDETKNRTNVEEAIGLIMVVFAFFLSDVMPYLGCLNSWLITIMFLVIAYLALHLDKKEQTKTDSEKI